METMTTEMELPDGWQRVKLGELVKKTKQRNPTQTPDEVFTYVDVSGVSNLTFEITETQKLLGSEAPSRARKVIRANDIILATVRPTLRRVAIVPSYLDNQVCSTGFSVIQTESSKSTAEFIYFFLLSDGVNKRLGNIQTGATYPAVSDGQVLSLEISLPPLPEQRAIANVLGAVQAALAARRREQQLEQEHKAALLEQLFTRGTRGEATRETAVGAVPVGWEVVKLGDAYSFTKKPRSIRYENFEQIPFVPMDFVPIGAPRFDKFLQKKPADLTSGNYFEAGDLLLARITPSFENGKQGVIEKMTLPFGIGSTELIPIQPKAGISDRDFLAYYLLRGGIRDELATKMEGSTGRQRLNKYALEKLLIPLPPLPEQKRIASVLGALDAKLGALAAEVARLEELFRALLEELLSGRRRVENSAAFGGELL